MRVLFQNLQFIRFNKFKNKATMQLEFEFTENVFVFCIIEFTMLCLWSLLQEEQGLLDANQLYKLGSSVLLLAEL